MALSAVLSERRVDSRTGITCEAGSPACLIYQGASHARQSSTASAAHTPEGANLHQAELHPGESKKSDAEHFCGFPQQCEFQLNF
jgi:hypothetical protein